MLLGTTGCWPSNSATFRCSGSISAWKLLALRWARSICGSPRLKRFSRRARIRPTSCPRRLQPPRSASSATSGFLATIASWSALDTDALAALMDEERAGTIFTDPPYNVTIDGHASGLGAVHHRPFPMASGEMSKAEFTAFLARALCNLVAFSTAGSLHYISIDWRHLDELLAAGGEAYGELKNLCVWVKHNSGMGSLYRSQHELIFVFKQCAAAHRNNIQLGQFGRNRSNVWHYPGANSFGRCGEERNPLALHPTVKPVTLVADAILDCTERGGIVLDTFLGSGTTLIAAQRTGRRCCGMELDPGYVDTTIRRWQALTGGSARHAASGSSFDDLAREVEAGNVA